MKFPNLIKLLVKKILKANLILTKIQNFILGTNLSEFHTGYRIYSIKTLKKIKFELNKISNSINKT